MWKRFRSGEGPSRVLLRDCENRWIVYSTSSGRRYWQWHPRCSLSDAWHGETPPGLCMVQSGDIWQSDMIYTDPQFLHRFFQKPIQYSEASSLYKVSTIDLTTSIKDLCYWLDIKRSWLNLRIRMLVSAPTLIFMAPSLQWRGMEWCSAISALSSPCRLPSSAQHCSLRLSGFRAFN